MNTRRSTTKVSDTAGAASKSIVLQITEAIAKREGVDPLELDIPLYEAINADALETLFTTSSSGPERPVSVEFTYLGYRVSVSGTDGSTITVEVE